MVTRPSSIDNYNNEDGLVEDEMEKMLDEQQQRRQARGSNTSMSSLSSSSSSIDCGRQRQDSTNINRQKKSSREWLSRRIYGHFNSFNSTRKSNRRHSHRSSHSTGTSSNNNNNRTVGGAVWNTVAVCMVLMTLLIATDIVQINHQAFVRNNEVDVIWKKNLNVNANSGPRWRNSRRRRSDNSTTTQTANQHDDDDDEGGHNQNFVVENDQQLSTTTRLPFFQYRPRGRVSFSPLLSNNNDNRTTTQPQALIIGAVDDPQQWGSWPDNIPPRRRRKRSLENELEDKDEQRIASVDPYSKYSYRDVPFDSIRIQQDTTKLKKPEVGTVAAESSVSSSSSSGLKQRQQRQQQQQNTTNNENDDDDNWDWWQLDSDYLSVFIPASLQLVERAQTAILAEYGYNTNDESDTRNDTATKKMFDLKMYDTLKDIKSKTLAKSNDDRGGWTTTNSWKGLKCRLLHAIMTEDSFIFAMGGHSAAAGHGNHFQQSYTVQVQWILEPIFARLGVKHSSRNFGQGGLGTTQNGLGATSIYGPDIDMLMWDSGMTEKEEKAQDLFHRQGLMSYKIPVLWTESVAAAKFWNEKAGVDVGMKGSGKSGIRKGKTWDEIQNNITYAARYMKCSDDLSKICRDNEYDGRCWIDRDDVKPPKKQEKVPGGRAKWHPGMRDHQLKGRVIAYTILQALNEVLEDWKSRENYRVPDSEWHMTKYYDDMRQRIDKVLDEGKCHDYKKAGIGRACSLPMQARTEFTPRAYPSLSSIRSLMPPSMIQYVDSAEPNIYDPPDVFNPSLYPPEDAIDVLSIVEAGPTFEPILNPDYHSRFYKKPTFSKPPLVPIGKGVSLETVAGDVSCDGTLYSWCNRGPSQECLLRAHNDGRNGLKFDSYSGWVVVNLPIVRNGLVIVKLESWHQPNEAYRTKGWTSVNNEGLEETRNRRQRHLLELQHETNATSDASTHRNDVEASESRRFLKKKKKPPSYCDDFRFEWAIDGEITSLNTTEFQERRKKGQIQRVVETVTLLDDPNYTNGTEQEVEVAVRIVGCGRGMTFNLNHVYWS